MGNIGDQVTLEKPICRPANLEPGVYQHSNQGERQHFQADGGSFGDVCRRITPCIPPGGGAELMLGKLATWVCIGLALPVLAADRPGAISGYVRNAPAFPRWAPWCRCWAAANRTFTVFTDEAGFYSASGLLPGIYTLKVTAPSFLPALREKSACVPAAA